MVIGYLKNDAQKGDAEDGLVGDYFDYLRELYDSSTHDQCISDHFDCSLD